METKNRHLKTNKNNSDLIFEPSQEIIDFRTNGQMLSYEVNNDYQQNKEIYKLREKIALKNKRRIELDEKYGYMTDEAVKKRWIKALIAVVAYFFLSFIFVYVIQIALIFGYALLHNGDAGLTEDSPLYASAMEFYNSMTNIIIYAIELAVILPILFGFVKYDFSRIFRTTKSTLVGIFTSIFSFPIVMAPYLLGYFITFLLGGTETSANQEAIDSMLFGKYGAILIVFVAIIGPIVEELVFRKGLHSLLFPKKKRFGWKMLRAFIVACIFGSIHVVSAVLLSLLSLDFSGMLGHLIQVFPYIGMGFGFSFLYEINDENIIPSTIAHVGWNSFSVLTMLLQMLMQKFM